MRYPARPPNALRQPAVTEALAQVGCELELRSAPVVGWSDHRELWDPEVHAVLSVTDDPRSRLPLPRDPRTYAVVVRGEMS